MKNIIKYFLPILALGLMACACDYEDAVKVEKVELGAPVDEYVVEAEETTLKVAVYSNGKYHVDLLDGAENWLNIGSEPAETDDSLTIHCEANEEFRRMAHIVLSSDIDSRKDTIVVKQEGVKVATLRMENFSVLADGGAGTTRAAITTNIPYSYMTVKVIYNTGGEDWIESVNITEDEGGDSSLEFTLGANDSETTPRSASITFSYADGWGDDVSLLVNLLQKTSKNTLGEVLDISSFIDKYATGKIIHDYVLIEGYVVSNTASGNAGSNDQKTTSAIDYTISERTVYLESYDGSRGISILTASEDDNVFGQYDKVQLLMHGLVADLKDDPIRCEVSGFTKDLVTSRIAGSKGEIPVKEKYIKDLTDEDVYTYVTLKDVEIPVRKGSLVPVNESFSIATGAHRFTEYPRLVRDVNGDDIYLVTNTVCTYRNDGTRLPYGSGKISGVVVHDAFPRMDWKDGADPTEIDDDPTLGNIGRYQIRHQNKSDIWEQMNDDFEDGFSALLAEYRYWIPSERDSVMRPSYGTNGWLDHTYGRKYTGTQAKEYIGSYKQHMASQRTYCYLGPVGRGQSTLFPAIDKTNPNMNGCGMVLDQTTGRDQIPTQSVLQTILSYNSDGSVEWAGPNSDNSDVKQINGTSSNWGKGWVDTKIYTAYSNSYWWDYETDRPYGWLVKFSTEGISTGCVSLQISVLNTSSKYGPRYWVVEWSLTPDQSAAADVNWHTVAEYTVPDISNWSNTLFSSSCGYKQLDFTLPLEILGQKNVYLRLRPKNDLCGDGGDYANSHMRDNPDGKAASTIEYLAIRYNK